MAREEVEEAVIVFHNDKLVPKALCEILYQTVPEEFHVPVVFKPYAPKRYPGRGKYIINNTSWVEIYLNRFRDVGLSEPAKPKIWRSLLKYGYHLFTYVRHRVEYDASDGNSDNALVYYDAEQWANYQLSRLLTLDERLFQPIWLGLLGHWCKQEEAKYKAAHLNYGKSNNFYPGLLDRRAYLSRGGQVSLSTIVRSITHDYDERLYVRRLALKYGRNLAKVYRSQSGRPYYFFTFGGAERLTERLRSIYTPQKKQFVGLFHPEDGGLSELLEIEGRGRGELPRELYGYSVTPGLAIVQRLDLEGYERGWFILHIPSGRWPLREYGFSGKGIAKSIARQLAKMGDWSRERIYFSWDNLPDAVYAQLVLDRLSGHMVKAENLCWLENASRWELVDGNWELVAIDGKGGVPTNQMRLV